MFGTKRSETDSFAGHGFTTACLAFLIALHDSNNQDLDDDSLMKELMEVVMVSLTHDLPVARTGDAAYDFQEKNRHNWESLSRNELASLVKDVSQEGAVEKYHEPWPGLNSYPAWVTRIAAAVDAWEMGVTTPSSWMYAWEDYRLSLLRKIDESDFDTAKELKPVLLQAYAKLSEGDHVRAAAGELRWRPAIEPIRIPKTSRQTT